MAETYQNLALFSPNFTLYIFKKLHYISKIGGGVKIEMSIPGPDLPVSGVSLKELRWDSELELRKPGNTLSVEAEAEYLRLGLVEGWE